MVSPEARQVWANLLWRDANVWYEKWSGLGHTQQQAAMASLTPQELDRLSDHALREMHASLEGVTDPSAFAVIGAALAIVQESDPREWFERLRPTGILELSDWRKNAVPSDLIDRGIELAATQLREEREQAIAGTFGVGGANAGVSLGALVAHTGAPNPDAEHFLIEIATDPRVSSDHQIDALQGLVHMRHAGLLSDDGRRQLRDRPHELGRDMWGVIDTSVLRIARLWSYADDLSPEEISEVVVACRARKQETRIIALASIEDILKAGPGNTSAAWAVVSALYDPSDDVLVRALEEVGRSALKQQPDVAHAALGGVITAYRTGRNRVRTASVWAVRAFGEQPDAQALIEAARHDVSWEVRFAVQLSAQA